MLVNLWPIEAANHCGLIQLGHAACRMARSRANRGNLPGALDAAMRELSSDMSDLVIVPSSQQEDQDV